MKNFQNTNMHMNMNINPSASTNPKLKINSLNINSNKLNVTQNISEANSNTASKQLGNNIKKIKLSANPTEVVILEKRMLLVSTEDNIFYLVSLKDYHFNIV